MKSLTRYTKKRLKRIDRLLNSFPESQDQEVLHLIRLEIKKVKALLRLIHYNDKSFKERTLFIPFRSIFRDCNIIREPQVLHSLIVKYTKDQALPIPYSSINVQQFIEHVPVYLKKVKKPTRLILLKIKRIKSSTYHRYLKKKKRELRNASRIISTRSLHSYRKLIKEIYYLLCVNSINKSIDPFFKKCDGLIGAWHDKSIVIQKIRKITPLQNDLIKKLQNEKRADLTSLKKLIKNYYH